MHWNDVFMRKHYNVLKAYKQSKLANVLFSTELNRRLGTDNSVHAYAVDPGLVNTNIGLKGTSGITRIVWQMRSHSGVDPSIPAASIAYLASEPSIQHSEYVYWKDCKPLKPSKYSQNAGNARRLWELSEKMCGIQSAQFGLGGNN
jgi:NAD(P)-dependent dehydrogenase (short-subunit alcohol dehydrogenase family)